ncbi:asparagine synthetase B family protein [Bradymonadaceae bacterium TMQ3]|uniref:Asparagine synthetase B family protein n=1 Tax=Lujinxingia sediminis TaxID=2480984 RepID=A0ABY0CP53_9DELT|nr:asparagine synthetase B family protein [Lujinxingia sediminis]RDV38088.1 asparagine synthetase B family protein [Bradymonadaceae bacterium TMQ3]RVU42242.1 asparagine synthetase B family protein [Lujinxingia sediminis]TXC75760.1 hypothetical protein FRC91_09660 [Bradymonadales bacterium TMQ1]
MSAQEKVPLKATLPGAILPVGDLLIQGHCGTPEILVSGPAVYQLALIAQDNSGWLCILGPPSAGDPLLDPTLPMHERIARLHHLTSRSHHARGLAQLPDLGVAVALRWDARRRELSVRRDAFGRVPLVHSKHPEQVAEGGLVSTRPVLLAPFSAPLRPPDAWHYFSRAQDAPLRDDFWPGVQRFFPGEERRFVAGTWETTHRLWSRNRHPRSGRPHDDHADERFAQLLAHATRAAIREPGPVFTLSGGLDSTSLVALAREQKGHRNLATASMVSSRHPGFDERPTIETLVHRWRTSHRFVDIGAPELWSPQRANPGVEDWGPVVVWEAPYMRYFFATLRKGMAPDTCTLVFGFGADQLLFANELHYLEQIAAHATPELLRSLLLQAATRRRWRRAARVLAARTGLLTRWRARFRPDSDPRQGLLEGWKWEASMRAFERYRRDQGVRLAFPFLQRELWETMLASSPGELRHGGLPKAHLRKILHHRAPDALTFAPKGGLFDEVVACGLHRLFAPSSACSLSQQPPSHSPFTAEQRRVALDWLRQGAPPEKRYEAAVTRYLTSFESWLLTVQ